MMQCEYKAQNGSLKLLDLDAVIDVVIGRSKIRPEWTATIVFDPATALFVELRSTPQDYRGNSDEEAEEVSLQYIEETFQVKAIELSVARLTSRDWNVILRQ